MAKIETLRDKDNEIVYPLTRTDAVIDEDSNNLAEELAQIKEMLRRTDRMPCWSRLVNRAIIQYGPLTTWNTTGGRTLTYDISNGGNAIRVYGADDIELVKYYFGVHSISGQTWTSNYRIANLKPESTCHSRIYFKFDNGTAGGQTETNYTVGSNDDYTSLVTVSGGKVGTGAEITCIRVVADEAGDYATWEISGTWGSKGVLESATLQAECTTRYGYLPCFYQGGANNTNVQNVFSMIEILEPYMVEES